MKLLAYIVILILLGTSNCFSRIITVDNKYPSVGMFTNLQDAHDYAPNDGLDTVYLYPSRTAYNGITITKKLIIIGNGWTDGMPADLNTGKYSQINSTITFESGSSGSKIMSLGGCFSIVINESDVVIEKNILRQIIVNNNKIGIIIKQNGIYSDGVRYGIYCGDNTNCTIMNNIVFNNNWWESTSIYSGYGGFSIIKNNIIYTANTMSNKSLCSYANYIEIENNIILWLSPRYDPGYPLCHDYGVYNLQFQEDSGFSYFQNFSTSWQVFGWHLSPNSPARGTGKDRTDYGIYGGTTPFIDGGYPGIPIIYGMDCDLVGSRQNGIKVKIKAKSNKE